MDIKFRKFLELWKKKSIFNLSKKVMDFQSWNLTSNTREPFDLSFNRLFFIQGLRVVRIGAGIHHFGDFFSQYNDIEKWKNYTWIFYASFSMRLKSFYFELFLTKIFHQFFDNFFLRHFRGPSGDPTFFTLSDFFFFRNSILSNHQVRRFI